MAVLVYCDENPCETLDSASNLRRALGIKYYMVIHDSKRSAQVRAGIRVDMASTHCYLLVPASTR